MDIHLKDEYVWSLARNRIDIFSVFPERKDLHSFPLIYLNSLYTS